jgi:hypothetical protein
VPRLDVPPGEKWRPIVVLPRGPGDIHGRG